MLYSLSQRLHTQLTQAHISYKEQLYQVDLNDKISDVFSPLEQIIVAGDQQEPLKQSELSSEEVQDLSVNV